MTRPPGFQQWLDSHHGVFTRQIALAHGVTVRRFRTGSESGEWVRYRGAWRLADANKTYWSACWAALILSGPDAALTGHSALAAYGFAIPHAPIVLHSPRNRHIRVPGAVVLRDDTLSPPARSVIRFPVVYRRRAGIDALRVDAVDPGRAILHELLRRRWLTEGDLAEAIYVFRCHKGNQNLRHHHEYAASGSRAESERRLIRMIRTSQLDGWAFNVDIYAANGDLLAVADAVQQASRTIVEVDGRAWHTAHDRFQRDRQRQNALVLAGWTVLRFTWEDLTMRPNGVIGQLRRITWVDS